MPLFKRAFPNDTTLIWTGERSIVPPEVDSSATPDVMFRAIKQIRAGQFDLIAVSPHLYRHYHPRYWLKSLFRIPWQPWSAITRTYGTDYIRFFSVPVPLIIIDMGDNQSLGIPATKLLDAATIVFKRELPTDRWRVLSGTAHPFLPTRRLRHSKKWQRRINKIHPVNLPQLFPYPDAHTFVGCEKTSDIFFAGELHGNSTVRQAGLHEIARLREMGFKVDCSENRLSKEEFFARMARSWLTWSPEGYGWQCYRHSEAGLVGSIPLINFPTIFQSTPFLDEINCFYYSPEPGGLVRAATKALADKEKLKKIATQARKHCLENYSIEACCQYMLQTTFQKNNTNGLDEYEEKTSPSFS